MARRVLVTRPEPGASATAARLADLGYGPVVLPLTTVVQVDPVALPDAFDAVIVSSANGFRFAPPEILRAIVGKPLFVVGRRTAEAAGRVVDHVAPDAAALVRDLGRVLSPRSRIVHVCGRVRRPELKVGLEARGHHVSEIEVYDAVPIAWNESEIGTKAGSEPFWAALVYSQRGGELLGDIVARERLQDLFRQTTFVCISIEAARALRAMDRTIMIAASPDEAAMLDLLGDVDA